MEKQLSQTRIASDKAVEYLESTFDGRGVVTRESTRIVKVTMNDPKATLDIGMIHSLPTNGFTIVGAGVEDGFLNIRLNIHDKMVELMPTAYVKCTNCYNHETITAETVEFFGLDITLGKAKEVSRCPSCEGDLGKRN